MLVGATTPKRQNVRLLVPISGLNERQVTEKLRGSTITVSGCAEEGLGMPPLEAAMSGCHVVEYAGYAAQEYMNLVYCTLVTT